MIPWNGLERAQYTLSFNKQIPVYFNVGINVTYLEATLFKLEEFEFVGQGIGSRVDNFETKLNW